MTAQVAFNTLKSALDVCRTSRTIAQGLSITDKSAASLIYEGILANAFRAHENFIESVFLEYLAGSSAVDGSTVSSFVLPQDLQHARRMLEAQGSRYLDWSDTAVIRKRCATFLADGDPLSSAVLGLSAELSWLKRIRNHVAHNSIESDIQYTGALNAILLVEPQIRPSAGELLQTVPTAGPVKNREVLAYLLDAIEDCAKAAVRVA